MELTESDKILMTRLWIKEQLERWDRVEKLTKELDEKVSKGDIDRLTDNSITHIYYAEKEFKSEKHNVYRSILSLADGEEQEVKEYLDRNNIQYEEEEIRDILKNINYIHLLNIYENLRNKKKE